MKRAILLLLLSVFSSNLFAVELFQGLEIGASHQEVLKKFPNAKPVNNSAYGKAPDNQMVVKNYKVFGENFDLRFTVLENGLNSVLLSLESPNSVWFSAFPALSSKYGKPYYNVNLGLKENLAIWSYKGFRITLQETNDGLTYITYDGEALSNASKL